MCFPKYEPHKFSKIYRFKEECIEFGIIYGKRCYISKNNYEFLKSQSLEILEGYINKPDGMDTKLAVEILDRLGLSYGYRDYDPSAWEDPLEPHFSHDSHHQYDSPPDLI